MFTYSRNVKNPLIFNCGSLGYVQIINRFTRFVDLNKVKQEVSFTGTLSHTNEVSILYSTLSESLGR